MSVFFCVDAAPVTNSNDMTAMLAFRQSFNNFTFSNWYSSNDPCGSPREFQLKIMPHASFDFFCIPFFCISLDWIELH
jgi:hypothetical protein